MWCSYTYQAELREKKRQILWFLSSWYFNAMFKLLEDLQHLVCREKGPSLIGLNGSVLWNSFGNENMTNPQCQVLDTVGVQVILQEGGGLEWEVVGWRGYHGVHLVQLQERKQYSLIKRAAAKSAVDFYEAAISPQLRETRKSLFLTDTPLCYSKPA